MRDTGTTTSSLIFLGAMLRRAGDSALRVAHKAVTSSALCAVLNSTRSTPRAAALMASAAASMASAVPSTSIMSMAPACSGKAAFA